MMTLRGRASGSCCCVLMMMLLVVVVVLELHWAQGFRMRDTTLNLNEIVWHSEKPQIFIGSPTVLRLSNGHLLAAADRFGSGFTGQPRNVSVFLSEDNGETWSQTAWVRQQYWSNLFHAHAQPNTSTSSGVAAAVSHATPARVYLLGTSSDAEGGIKIASSEDGGRTWPVNASAMLFNATQKGYYATGATPILHASDGRLYRAIELFVPPHKWGKDFAAVVISAPAKANLLDPASWTISPALPFNTSWIPSGWPQLENPGYLEGNMVEGPDGTIYNILRFNVRPHVLGNYAVALRYNPKQNKLTFDRVFALPGGHTKFTIRRDSSSGLYLAITNPNTDIKYTDQRNILVLCASKDLFNWTVATTLLQDDTGLSAEDSVRYTGFHYVDWQFDGANASDIIYVIRTAYRGAVSYHNSNRMTFKRIVDWRSIVLAPSSVTVQNARMHRKFSPDIHSYTIDVPQTPTTVNVTVTSAFSDITINGQFAKSGNPTQVRVPRNSTTIHISCDAVTYSLTAIVPTLPEPAATATLTGHGYEVGVLTDGAVAFSDRSYVWCKTPYQLQGLNFTRIPGGASDVEVTAHVREDGLLVVATHDNPQSLVAEGWQLRPSWTFSYTDANHSEMQVVTRHASKGEAIRSPQEGWAGRVLIFSAA